MPKRSRKITKQTLKTHNVTLTWLKQPPT